jgi:hypothetical protein
MFHRYEHRKVKDLYPGAENGLSEEELDIGEKFMLFFLIYF